jgi:hypothetical protein
MRWKFHSIQREKRRAVRSRELWIEQLEDRQLLAVGPGVVPAMAAAAADPEPVGQSSALSTYVPPTHVATPTNPVQTVRVIVLNFEPTVPSMDNRTLWEIFNWNDPRNLAAGFVSDVETASGGAIDYQIVEWRDLNEFPIFTDGFRYTADQYVFNRQTNPPNWWNTNAADFYVIAEQQGLAELVNNNVIDEIWMFGDHFFNLLGEAWMAGPQSFFINGPSFPDFPIDRAVAGFGFNYERGVAEMLHNFGHRTENHGSRMYGGWNITNPATHWDYFTANVWQTSRPTFGVGSTHFPANGTADYDYANTQTVNSYADDFVMNFPNHTLAAVPITRDAWGDLGTGDWHRGYMRWFFGHLPRGSGIAPDGRQNNWYKYTNDFNSYRPNTGAPRDNEAILGAAPLSEAGPADYEFTLRYYDVQGIDTGTLGNTDVLVTGPGGFSQLATLVEVETAQATTAGTARTVRYRVSPPGGAWDAADAGSYSVALRANEVRDLTSAFLPGAPLGVFQVNIAGSGKLDIESMLATGQATVTATTWDIGGPGAIFDNSTGSLYRTPNIDPAIVTLSFTTPQTLTGFRTLLTHTFGDPAYRWKVEAADSLAHLDSQSGTYQLLVPFTNTPSDVFSTVMLGTAASARHVRLTAERLTGDNYVHLNSWELLGPVVNDVAAPAATMTAPPVAATNDEATTFVVRYTDDMSVDFRTINFGDIRVTGPNGFSQTAALYGLDVNAGGTARNATYFVSAPGGVWDFADNGIYTVTLLPQQVFDKSGKPVAPLVLGSFVMNAPLPEGRPKLDMTEQNAADWIAWAQSATASTSNDTSRKSTGAASVRFDTTGGFDTFLRYEPPNGAMWNLTHANQFHFDVYAQNPSPSGFQESPIIRFIDTDGDWMEFRYYRDNALYPRWSDARGLWLSETIPIKSTAQPATGWRGTSNGTPDWSRMRTVEIHADTWDFGFTLWFDRMSFNVPVVPGDFTGDLAITAVDIDHLAQADDQPDNPLFDLDNNGVVSYEVGLPGTITSDSDVLIRSILGTEYGDLDLDGKVFLSDLGEFAIHYRQPGLFGWADGNINGSQQAGTSGSPRVFLDDLSVLATYWRYGVASGAAAMADSAVDQVDHFVGQANFGATQPPPDSAPNGAVATIPDSGSLPVPSRQAVGPRPVFAARWNNANHDHALLAAVTEYGERRKPLGRDQYDDDLLTRADTLRAERWAALDEAFESLPL